MQTDDRSERERGQPFAPPLASRFTADRASAVFASPGVVTAIPVRAPGGVMSIQDTEQLADELGHQSSESLPSEAGVGKHFYTFAIGGYAK